MLKKKLFRHLSLTITALLATSAMGYVGKSYYNMSIKYDLAIQNIANRTVLKERHETGKQTAPRYIFLDAGARYGVATTEFKNSDFYSQFPWEIIAFEANPFIVHRIAKSDNVMVFNQAVWKEDGLLDFYLAKMFKSTASSSVIKEKKTGGLSKTPISVESVDFGALIKRNFSPDDVIILKMDIEGAEYAVLEKMLTDGSMSYINKIYVEFHNEKVSIPREKDLELIEAITSLGIDLEEEPIYQGKSNWFQDRTAALL